LLISPSFSKYIQITDKYLENKQHIYANLYFTEVLEKNLFKKDFNSNQINLNEKKIIKFIVEKYGNPNLEQDFECIFSDKDINLFFNNKFNNLFFNNKFNIVRAIQREKLNFIKITAKPKININVNKIYLKFFFNTKINSHYFAHINNKSIFTILLDDDFNKQIKNKKKLFIFKYDKKYSLNKMSISTPFGFNDINNNAIFSYKNYYFVILEKKFDFSKRLIHFHFDYRDDISNNLKLEILPNFFYAELGKSKSNDKLNICPEKYFTLHATNKKNLDNFELKENFYKGLIERPIAETSNYQLFIDSAEKSKLARLDKISYLFNVRLEVKKKILHKNLNKNVKILTVY
jgi:hypothetical protein